MRTLEYCMLHDVKATGQLVGFYAGKEISESVVDEHGRSFDYVGVASRRANGQLDGDALRPGEFILHPGLVYRFRHTRKTWWEQYVSRHDSWSISPAIVKR